jgi:hypothetical protein
MRLRTWARRSITVLLLLAVLNVCISVLLRGDPAHRYLTARLAESFGRPLEVGRFDFSFLDGLRLSAKRITVGEDPRFGQEYFLRAEQLTAGVRWRQFLKGRFEFGTLTFSQPSLNLVRASNGRWNIENWLPARPASSERSVLSMPHESAGHLYKIKIDGGRINFKSGADKHPFALVDVLGSIEQESPGRWRLDLEAIPKRAGVTLQQSGTLRVAGRIAGTSARLQPAELSATWADASIADMLRLAHGKDYGVRGLLTLQLNALSQSERVPGWSFALVGQAQHVHRWDLPGRVSDPDVNVIAEALWDPREPRLRVVKASATGPHSQLQGTGEVLWQSGIEPEFQFHTAAIDFADLFGWYRAFQPNVAEQTSLKGSLSGGFAVRGWPIKFTNAEFKSPGAALDVTGLRAPISLGELSIKLHDGRFAIDPIAIYLPAIEAKEAATELRSERKGSAGRSEAPIRKRYMPELRPAELLKISASISLEEKYAAITVDGKTSRAEDLLLVMKSMGHPINSNWTLGGPVNFNFRRDIRVESTSVATAGWLELQGSRLQVTGLNFPLHLDDARIEWKNDLREVTLRAARALGAQWTGRLVQQDVTSGSPPPPWKVDLSADHLSAADLDHWLGPRGRRGFLERLLPGFAPSAAQAAVTSVDDYSVRNTRAAGRIEIGELEIAPLLVRKLQGRVDIRGRTVRLEDARGEFYGGKVSGSFEADLKALPEYRADAEIERTNLAALTAATTTLRERFGGFASASIHLTARGIGRDALAKSFEGVGKLSTRELQVRGLDLKTAMAARTFHSGIAQWSVAEGLFAIDAKGIRITRLRLKDGATSILAEGTVDFSHALDFEVRALPDSPDAGALLVPVRAVHLTGTLESPRLERMIPGIEPKPASN